MTDNGDGTYTLSLSVTGTASSVTTSNKADVIVVIDTSNSMNNHIEHETGRFGYRNGNYINLYSRSGNSYSQLTDDTYSGTVYYRAGASYFTYTGTRYSVTRLAVAKDSVNSLAQQLLANNTAENPDRVQLSLVTFGTNASTRITGTTNLSNFQSTVNGLTTNGGTNWEDALKKANAVATRPGAEAYVIFVSDGNPTYWLNPNGSLGGNGGEGASNVATAYSQAVPDAQAIVGAGKHFYGIGVFGSVSRMQSLVTDAGAPANNYYSATDQAALNAAFTTIINEITNAFGYTDVSINDGLTGMTAAALVAGQPDGFTYTRSGGSYGGGTAWDGAPPATYNGSAVSWDLGSMTLENGVTYTVSFKVWPKQEAYDLVADLNNGFIQYDSLSAEQQAQIVALTGGGYGLKTNTEANISYTQIETITTSVLPDGATQNPDGSYSHDGFTYTQNADGTWTGTKETEGTGTFDSPDPMPLTNSKMMVTKTWNDSIDPDQRPDEVTLRILRDDDSYAEVVLNAANNWTQQIDVAPGLIVDGETLETGHDYTIEEVDPDYHFELDADPFHPMIVDGVLNKNETGGATVTATNDLKGRLNISKTVTHSSDTTPNPNQLFTYTIKIDESNDDDVWFSIGNSSGPIDVSGENRVTGATVGTDPKYYHAASGTEITVKIKGGENIYFLNLAAGSTYEVEEVNVPSAYTCTVTNSDSGATTSGNKTSGSIVSNTLHTVAYTNAYAVSPTTATIPVTKVLSIPAGQTGPGDITGEFTFTLTAADGTPMPDDTELTNPGADGGTVSFGDITYTKPGTYTYTVTEAGFVDGVSNDPQASKTITVVVTDNGDGTLSATVNGANPTPTDPANTTFTNSYATTEVSAQIPVTKTLVVPSGLTGPGDITGKYTFTLAAQGGAPMPAAGGETVTNPAATGGTASFGSITYDAPGEYTYIITEDGEVDGVTNDTAAETGKTVTVEVVDNGNGTLSATIKGADSATGSSTTFTNTYGATPATANIPVKKVLSAASGLTPPDITGAYTFTLVGVTANAPMPAQTTLTNPDANGGTVTFGAISFSRIGTYTYTVSEDGEVDGVTNDSSGPKTATVTVTDDGKGKLSASVSVSADNPLLFTNTYNVKPTTAVIPVTKVLSVPEGLTGPASIKEAYTFTLTPQSGAPAPATSSVKNPDANGGTASFGAITFVAPGTYTYKITEAGTVAGVVNDPAAETGKTVTVEVVDNGDGTLTATVKGADGTEEEPSEGTTFTNTYAASGSVTLEATKVAVGFELEADQFSFELKDAEGNVLQTKTNDAAGKIAFDAISYSEAGTYNYTINEVVIDGNGIAEDTHVANVEVTVVDNGDGTLTATPEYEDATFTNTHTDTEKDVVSAGDTTTSVDGELVQAGDTLTYTITYANNTSGVATVTVTDAIPANTTYVDGSASDGGVEAGGTITWTIENVAAGATGTVTFQVTVDEGANGETIENAATVFDGENQSSSNAVTTSIPVKDVLDADDASVDGGSAQVGDTLTYEVTFTLTKDCTSVVVTDDVPANTTLVDGSVSDGGVEAGGTITWDLGALDAGTYTVSFQVTVDESAVTADAITNTASISVNNHSEVETNTTTTTTEKGGLTISKEILVPAGFEIDKDKVFTFTVSLVDKNGAALTGEYDYTGSSVGTIRNGGSIELKHGESITIAGLPAGTKYKIVETAVAGYTAVQDTFEAVIPNGGEPAAAAFKNKYGDDLETTVSFPVEKVLSVPDGLTGPDIREKYTFKLNAKVGTPMPDKTELKNPDATGGRVTFGPITYDTPGVYEYTVTEDGTVTGVVNDVTASKTVTVTVTDNGDGTLTATASSTEDGPLTFTNSYSVNSTTATITAKKLLEHADLAAGAFNFVLSAADGTPMPASPNATNAADGTVAFGEITYSVPGTFTYTIKETAGSATYFDYDGSEKTVTVEVVDNGDGTLTATVTGDGDDATFTNTYKAGSDEVFINAVKNVNGEAASLNMFEFTIAADDGGALPDETTVTNNGGSVTFGPIKYDVSIFDDPAPAPDPDEPETVSLTFIPVGIEGTIMRAVPYLNGVPRDELLVEIRKDDEGAWEPHTWEGLPSRDDEGNDIAFEVYYTVDEGTTPERASGLMLQLTGGAAAEPAEPTAPRVKVFHYTITETDGGAPGYTYDGHSEMVIVRVTDNGDGTLDTEVEYDEDGAVFNNAYEASGEAEIEATKVLNGTDLAAGQFEFGLFEGDTQVGGAVTNGADGSIVFTVPYSNVDLGTHVYTVRELVGTPQTGYTYDSSSKTVTVEVTDNGDGTLSTEVEYGGDMTFTNAYKPLPTEVTLEAEKVLEGRDLVTGEFDFMLEDEDGNVVSSGTNDASGKIAFSAIPITKAGTYIFTAYEVKGDAAGVTYDDTRFVYEVDVEDDGGQLTITEVRTNDRVLFTNTYAEPPVPTPDPEPKPTPQKPAVRKGKAALPKTGDPTSPFYSAILAGISVVAMLAGALLKVRPQEKRAVGHSATPKRGGRA